MKKFFKILGYGFLLLIANMILLFLASIIFGSEQPVDLPGAVIAVAVAMAIVSYLFALLAKVQNKKEAITYGVSWAIIVLVLTLLITIPNGTTKTFFGNWSVFLTYLGVLAGPLFTSIKKKVTDHQA